MQKGIGCGRVKKTSYHYHSRQCIGNKICVAEKKQGRAAVGGGRVSRKR